MITLTPKGYVIVAILAVSAVVAVSIVDAILYGTPATTSLMSLALAIVGWLTKSKAK